MSAAQADAIDAADAARFMREAANARSVQEAMIVEAQAARLAWPDLPALRWRIGSPRIPPQWKAPPSTRSRRFARPGRSDTRRIRSTRF